MRSSIWRRGAAVTAVLTAVLALITTASSASAGKSGSGVGQAANGTLVQGQAADPSITWFDGNYYLIYNKEGFADSIIVRRAPSLGALDRAADVELWHGSRGPREVAARVGLGAWLLPWGGRWYLYGWGDDGTSVTTSRPFVLESAGGDPMGPYTHRTTFTSPAPQIGGDGHGYAASPIQVGNRLYLTQTSNGRIFLAELTNPWTLGSAWQPLAQPAGSGWECANGRCIDEGGSAIVHNGQVYLLFSAGGYESPDYCVGMLTAPADADLLDQRSWRKSDGCVVARNDAEGAYGPASMIWFHSPDGRETWVSYHIKTSTVLTGADRVLQAQKVGWIGNRPRFSPPRHPDRFQALPSGDPGYPVIEAESGIRRGAAVVGSNYASGGKFVRLTPGAALTVTVQAAYAGEQQLRVWYRAETGQRPRLALSVNGRTAGVVDLAVGGPPEHFPLERFASVLLPLRAGVNQVTLTGVAGVSALDKFWLDDRTASAGPAVVEQGDSILVLRNESGRLTALSCQVNACAATASPGAPSAGITGQPGAVARGDGVDVFAVGHDGLLWHARQADGTWGSWAQRGAPPAGLVPGGVSVASRGAGNLDVYALGSDGRVWSTAWDEARGTWVPWFAPDQRGYGVGMIAAPAAVARKATQIDVAMPGADGHTWLTWWDSRSWHTSYPVGAPPVGGVSAPAIASPAPDSLLLAVRGTDGTVWSRLFVEAFGWGTWTAVPGAVPGRMLSAPGLTADQTAHTVTVICVDSNGGLWRADYSAGAWSPWRALAIG